MLPSGYLSVSQINKYLACPKSYEYKYIQKLPETKSSALAVGSSFHKTVEEYNRSKVETGELLQDNRLKEIYEDSWSKNSEDIDWKDSEDPEEEKERGFTLAKAYIDEYGKVINPQGLETKFQVSVEGIPFIGFIDLIEQDGSIRDLKTSKRSPQKDVAEKSLQLSAYAYAYRQLTGEQEKVCSLDYAVSLKKAPKIVRLETEVDEKRIDRFKDTTYQVANAIDKEVFYRNEGMACSYCSFQEVCKEG